MPAGRAAARAAGEYQVRNIRSTNSWIAQVLVLRIRGTARANTSRYPAWALHLRDNRFMTLFHHRPVASWPFSMTNKERPPIIKTSNISFSGCFGNEN